MAESKRKKVSASKTTKATIAPERRSARRLPDAETLKGKFKEGNVPLQGDFADLIDLANAGAQATGQAAGQSGPGKGMRISDSGQLELVNEIIDFVSSDTYYMPAVINKDTNEVVIDLSNYSALYKGSSGLAIKEGSGIIANENGVQVKAGAGIRINDQGEVEPDAEVHDFTSSVEGIRVTGNSCPVMINKDSGKLVIPVSHSGLKYTDSFLYGTGLTVLIDENLGLEYVVYEQGDTTLTSAIAVKLGENGGLVFDENGSICLSEKIKQQISFSVPQFHTGMVTAFLGPEVPEGWALCDGKNKTPDLRSMFIPLNKGSAEKRDADQNDAQLVYIIKK